MEQKKRGGFFQRIPKETLLTPAGMVGVMLACFLEVSDWILDYFHILYPGKWESLVMPIKTFFDLIFGFSLSLMTRTSVKSNILPFLVERIPFISTILPTWVLRIII